MDVPLPTAALDVAAAASSVVFAPLPVDLIRKIATGANLDTAGEKGPNSPDAAVAAGRIPPSLWGAGVSANQGNAMRTNIGRFVSRGQIPAKLKEGDQDWDQQPNGWWNMTFFPQVSQSRHGTLVIPFAVIYASSEAIARSIAALLQQESKFIPTFGPQPFRFHTHGGVSQINVDGRLLADNNALASFTAACVATHPVLNSFITVVPVTAPGARRQWLGFLERMLGEHSWMAVRGASAGLAVAMAIMGGPPVTYSGQLVALAPDTVPWRNKQEQWTNAETSRSYAFVHSVDELPLKLAWSLQTDSPFVIPYKTEFGTAITKWLTNDAVMDKRNVSLLRLGRSFYTTTQADSGIGFYKMRTPWMMAATLTDAGIVAGYAFCNYYYTALSAEGTDMTMYYIADVDQNTGLATFNTIRKPQAEGLIEARTLELKRLRKAKAATLAAQREADPAAYREARVQTILREGQDKLTKMEQRRQERAQFVRTAPARSAARKQRMNQLIARYGSRADVPMPPTKRQQLIGGVRPYEEFMTDEKGKRVPIPFVPGSQYQPISASQRKARAEAYAQMADIAKQTRTTRARHARYGALDRPDLYTDQQRQEHIDRIKTTQAAQRNAEKEMLREFRARQTELGERGPSPPRPYTQPMDQLSPQELQDIDDYVAQQKREEDAAVAAEATQVIPQPPSARTAEDVAPTASGFSEGLKDVVGAATNTIANLFADGTAKGAQLVSSGKRGRPSKK